MKTPLIKLLTASIVLAVPPIASAEEEKAEKTRLSPEEMIAAYDKDGDGKVSDKERVPWLKKRMKENPKFAKKLMKQYDADKDGELTDAELTEASKKLREEMAMKRAKKKAAEPAAE